jgi:hypothetical protein
VDTTTVLQDTVSVYKYLVYEFFLQSVITVLKLIP